MNIYQYTDYKAFIQKYVETLPNKGRGEYGRIAKAAQISSTLVSQIFKGTRELTLEQTFLISNHLNLSIDEADFLELLVLYKRAGIEKQKKHYLQKIKSIQKKNKSFKIKVNPQALNIPVKDEVTYYTEWIHSAVRLLCEIEKYQTLESLSKKLRVDIEQVKSSVLFLNSIGLISYTAGSVTGLKKNLHLEKSSPLTYLRQLTWRMKALENFQRKDPEDYTFNALVTLEEKHIEQIKDILKEGVSQAGSLVEKTKSPKEMMCLNIDFFKV